MRVFFLIIGLCFLWLSNTTAQLDTSHYTIYFEVNQSVISPNHATELLDLLKLPRIQSIELEGHTDSDASDAYNIDLAVSRVAKVQAFLINNGANYQWLSTKALGEKEPKLPNISTEAKAQNRRVEVVVFYQKELPPVITDQLSIEPLIETPVITRLDTLNLDNRALNDWLSTANEKQLFKICNQTGGCFTTNSGMKVCFVANSFTQSCSDSIVIQVTEYNTRADIVTGNMSTLSSEKDLLYSSGMFEIMAFCDNQELELKNNQSYTAFIPITKKEQESNEMQCFYGEQEEGTEQVNWLLAKDENGNHLGVNQVDGRYLGSNNAMGGTGGSSCWFVRMLAKVGNVIAVPFVAIAQLFGGGKMRRAKKQRRKEQEKAQRAFMKEYGNIPIDEMNLQDVQYYVVQPTRMRYINCDAFYREKPENLMAQKVKIDGHEIADGTSVRIVFINRRSVMNSSIVTNEYFSFYNIPKGREIYVIATKMIDDPDTGEKSIYLGVENIVTKPFRTVNVAMEPMSSVKELHQRLKFMQ
jgi:hypothetical protein